MKPVDDKTIIAQLSLRILLAIQQELKNDNLPDHILAAAVADAAMTVVNQYNADKKGMN